MMRPSLWRDDSGAVAVIVAVSMVAIVALAALVVDIGYQYDTRHQLQAAADAAALAGCSVLIETEDPAAAEAEARQYALLNATGAGDGLAVQDVIVQMAAEPWSVKVIVARDVPHWFAQIVGPGAKTVHADSKAIKARLEGARNLMPWALPIILDEDIDRVEAALSPTGWDGAVSGPITLSDSGGRRFEGALTAPSSAGGYHAFVRVYNVFGVFEWVGDSKGEQPADRVTVANTAYPFTQITMDDAFVTQGESWSVDIHVTTKEPATKVTAEVGKTKVTFSGSGTSWGATITSADIAGDDGFLETFPIDIGLGTRGDGTVDAYLHIRRDTFPFESVQVDPAVVAPGENVSVGVDLSDFDPTTLAPGTTYVLRVGSDGVETGNFGELNYSTILHTGDCPPDPAGVDLGNNLRDWVLEGYGGGVHEGDIITMSPGKSGWTPTLVAEHIAKYGDIVVVPIVSKYEDKSNGSFDVIVRKFAAFRIAEFSDAGGEKGIVTAEFIEYVATPHTYTGGGGTGTAFAPRLVNP